MHRVCPCGFMSSTFLAHIYRFPHHAQLFNEINSRKIRDELNVFKGFLSSIVFTVVLALTVGFQVRACAGWAAPCVGPGGEVASRGA